MGSPESPDTLAIAMRLAAGTPSEVSSEVLAAWNVLRTLILEEFPEQANLIAHSGHSSASQISAFRAVLNARIAGDQLFASRLQSVWSRLLENSDGIVVNYLTGTVNGGAVQAKTVVLQGDFHNHQPPEPPPLVPRQLPADISHFAGRDIALAQLDGHLHFDSGATPTVVVSAISGTPGVGKTALAVHWAHRAAEKFPDGQIYLNLRGYAADPPMQPAEALGQLLRALGVPGPKIPAVLDEQASLYRTLLATRRVLIILDNAHSSEQVRPLVPGSTPSTVLITSRDDLSGLMVTGPLYRISIDVFSTSDSIALLSNIAGATRVDAERQDAERLSALCGGLPLALRIAAERLLARPMLSITTAVAELAAEQLNTLSRNADRTANVRAVFSWSYKSLTPAAQRAFRLLGLHPGPTFGYLAGSTLLKKTITTTDQILEELTRAHLLEEIEAGRFRFHDLLRLYARELVETRDRENSRRESMERVLEWYLHSISVADTVLNPHRRRAGLELQHPVERPVVFQDWAQALGWCDVERVNLVASARAAFSLNMYPLAWKIPLACFTFFRLRSLWNDWVEAFQIALTATIESHDRYAEAWISSNLAIGHKQSKNFQLAEEYFSRALDIRREIGDEYGEGQTLHHLAALKEAMNQDEEALDIYRRSLQLHLAAGNKYCEGTTLNGLGGFFLRQGNPGAARQYYISSLEIHTDIGYRYGQAETLHDLGRVQESEGLLDEAVESFERAIEIRRAIGHRWGLAETLCSIADIYMAVGDLGRARSSWEEAKEVFESVGDPRVTLIVARLASMPTIQLDAG